MHSTWRPVAAGADREMDQTMGFRDDLGIAQVFSVRLAIVADDGETLDDSPFNPPASGLRTNGPLLSSDKDIGTATCGIEICAARHANRPACWRFR
jgi:hypothetical protein